MKKPKDKQPKKLTRHTVTFETDAEQDVIIKASIGIGNKELMRTTGFSDSQITYKLAKVKRFLGRTRGFRVDWREGKHPLLVRILTDISSVMRLNIERDLVPKIVHPTPKTVKVSS